MGRPGDEARAVKNLIRPENSKGSVNTAHSLLDSRLINTNIMSYNDWAPPPFVYPIIVEHDKIFEAFPLHFARDQKLGLGEAQECDCVTCTRGSHLYVPFKSTCDRDHN